tara:strand:- start:1383 stop:1799 length:417 start_codon:yes stop_codon:yes gene_type:complete
MKKFFFLSSLLILLTSSDALAQKNKFKDNYKKHYSQKHNNFSAGLFAGLFLGEIFSINSTRNRNMYFKYNYNQDTWRLKKDYSEGGFGYYKRGKVIAKFENPNGGRDFVVSLNKRGEWYLDCPKRLRKLFKNKVRRNL